jgi:kynureninase
MEFLLNDIDSDQFKIITPEERGCQLSILVNDPKVFKKITAAGVVADWREPDVVRVAPVPLYNTFEEVWRFGQIFKRSL